jgi:hypothetical protein
VLSKLKVVGKEVAASVSFTLRFIDLSLTARLRQPDRSEALAVQFEPHSIGMVFS